MVSRKIGAEKGVLCSLSPCESGPSLPLLQPTRKRRRETKQTAREYRTLGVRTYLRVCVSRILRSNIPWYHLCTPILLHCLDELGEPFGVLTGTCPPCLLDKSRATCPPKSPISLSARRVVHLCSDIMSLRAWGRFVGSPRVQRSNAGNPGTPCACCHPNNYSIAIMCDVSPSSPPRPRPPPPSFSPSKKNVIFARYIFWTSTQTRRTKTRTNG